MHEGHGNHWEAIFEDLSELKSWLDVMVEQGRVIDSRQGGPPRPGETVGITWPDAPLASLSLVTGAADEETRFVFASSYPFSTNGIRHKLVVEEIIPWKNGIEGWVRARAPNNDGPDVTFFYTRHYAHRDRLARGLEAEFVLSGLAYFAEVSHLEPAVIRDPDKIRAMRAGTPQADDPTPIEIRMEGARILFPRDDQAPDEYEFHGPVKALQTFELFKKSFTRITLPVARFLESDEDLDINVYVGQHVWGSNERPLPGADVGGIMWLQGCLAGEN